jgi:hypothetical protein
MAKSKSKARKKASTKKPKKALKRSKKDTSKIKTTLKISSIAAIIYAIVIIPIILFGGFATKTLALKIIDSVLLAILTVLAVLILKAYCVLTKKFKFALVMTRILIIFTILVGIYNILRLYTLNSIILLYIATWLAGLIYVLFGIGLLRIKKISIMFTVLAVFYIVAGVFNASLILMVLLPAMAVTTAVVEAVLFKHLAK